MAQLTTNAKYETTMKVTKEIIWVDKLVTYMELVHGNNNLHYVSQSALHLARTR